MIDDYYCKCCNYRAKQKCHYDKHILTKKHRKLAQISPELAQISPQLAKTTSLTTEHVDDQILRCKYCDTTFKHKSSLCRHIKYVCKKNDDEDIRELIRLLNEQNAQCRKKDEQITQVVECNNKLAKDNERMQKQIDKLSHKLKITNFNTTGNTTGSYNNTINNNYNVKLLNFSETDYSHLTKHDYMKCIRDCNECVKTLIEKVHFNTKKPENMNLYIASMKEKYIMVYKNNAWTLENRKEIINDLYDYNECEIDDWYDAHKHKYPQIVDKYEKFQKNKNDKKLDIVGQVKEMIMMDCYNKRQMVKENDRKINDLPAMEGEASDTIVENSIEDTSSIMSDDVSEDNNCEVSEFNSK